MNTEQPQTTTEAPGGASDVERVVRLLIESDNYNQYACKMVRYKGKDLTTVGNMLAELSAEIKKVVDALRPFAECHLPPKGYEHLGVTAHFRAEDIAAAQAVMPTLYDEAGRIYELLEPN